MTAPGSPQVDNLPPFAAVTSDEERERKAEHSSPGTYYVVLNPDSFQYASENSESEAEEQATARSPARRSRLAVSSLHSQSTDLQHVYNTPSSIPYNTSDPNVVILRRFEDDSQLKNAPVDLPELDGKPPAASMVYPANSFTPASGRGWPDRYLLQQFRKVVWKQLTQIEVDDGDEPLGEPGPNIFEHTAASFLPLLHAMKAVAALSLAHQEGTERLDALQNYQQALSALQSNIRTADGLISDGVFFTYFLLLVYEVAAAESEGSNLWAHLLAQLLRISLLRRDSSRGERFPFIVWWTFNIDMYALFSGAGKGGFVRTMLKKGRILPPGIHFYPPGKDGSSIVFADEIATLPIVLQLNYENTLLAVRLGLMANEFQQEAQHNPSLQEEQQVNVKTRQKRIVRLRESFRQLWVAPNTILLGQQLTLLPRRSRQLFEHASSLYRACFIFSHISMWPTQRLDMRLDFDREISLCVTEILETAERVVAAGWLDLRSMIFPLFMAGVASMNENEKMVVLDLISRMETRSIGGNTTATKHALQIVYERQTKQFMHTGHYPWDVDWREVMVEHGVQVVSFGL